MRRETRKHENSEKRKNILYIGGSILAIVIIVFAITFVIYGNKIEEQTDIGAGKIAALVQEAATNTQVASTQIGKTVEEAKNEIENTSNNNTTSKVSTTNNITSNTTTANNTISNTTAVNNKTEKNTTTKSKKTNTTNSTKTETTNTVGTNTKQESTSNQKEETNNENLTFIKPVEGEISKEYAKENLVYSETLQEWTTHLGIDIKADKTTVVKAAATGKVKSIKNDPRYGLSIIIEHQNGYETLYANLLTTEFVQVGEEVKQGQSIGTVGNTATFEIADDAHLHFEISRNGETVDPSGVLK